MHAIDYTNYPEVIYASEFMYKNSSFLLSNVDQILVIRTIIDIIS